MQEIQLLRDAFARNRAVFLSVATVIALSLVAVLLYAEDIKRVDHERMVAMYEDQIATLRWIGATVGGGLVTAVGVLYRALEKSHTRCQEENRKAIRELAEELRKLA